MREPAQARTSLRVSFATRPPFSTSTIWSGWPNTPGSTQRVAVDRDEARAHALAHGPEWAAEGVALSCRLQVVLIATYAVAVSVGSSVFGRTNAETIGLSAAAIPT